MKIIDVSIILFFSIIDVDAFLSTQANDSPFSCLKASVGNSMSNAGLPAFAYGQVTGAPFFRGTNGNTNGPLESTSSTSLSSNANEDTATQKLSQVRPSCAQGPRSSINVNLETRSPEIVEKQIIRPPLYAQGPSSTMSKEPAQRSTINMEPNSPEITVQGGSLKTWSFTSSSTERVQVILKTEGRPLDADVELWAGPDNTPHKMRIYLENGTNRPFSAIMETPNCPSTIAVRNIGQLEFPLTGHIDAVSGTAHLDTNPSEKSGPVVIQGGALRTFPFDPTVDSVELLLKTDGRPLNARIELLQGPNNNKQVMEVYTEDGLDRPLYTLIKTPGSGNVVRIVNTATVEFPMHATVNAYEITPTVPFAEMQPVITGGGYAGPIDRKNFKFGHPQW